MNETSQLCACFYPHTGPLSRAALGLLWFLDTTESEVNTYAATIYISIGEFDEILLLWSVFPVKVTGATRCQFQLFILKTWRRRLILFVYSVMWMEL